MAEKNRNQPNQADQQVEQERTGSGQRQNISNENDIENNPQRGSEWSNYQTRELSSKQDNSAMKDLDKE
jgi:hypothetical protein